MDLRTLIFTATLVVAAPALATGTGPTLPDKSREHPLDTREPRQDVIETPDRQEPRPPTLEAPPEVPPPEPVEPPPPAPVPQGIETSGRAMPASWAFD